MIELTISALTRKIDRLSKLRPLMNSSIKTITNVELTKPTKNWQIEYGYDYVYHTEAYDYCVYIIGEGYSVTAVLNIEYARSKCNNGTLELWIEDMPFQRLITVNGKIYDVSMYSYFGKELENASDIRNLIITDWSNDCIKDLTSMFEGCAFIESITLNTFELTDIVSIRGMFDNCQNLKSITVIDSIGTHISDLSYAFNRCTALKDIDLSFIRSNVIKGVDYMLPPSIESIRMTKILYEKIKENDTAITPVITEWYPRSPDWSTHPTIQFTREATAL